MSYKDEYERWLDRVTDTELQQQLQQMDVAAREDAFYRELDFGTAGLRGVLGAGTNRMNVYTVAKASQGMANYLLQRYGDRASVAIGYDSRIKSDVFSRTAASVFAGNGIAVHIYPQLSPVPEVSFAVRFLHCSAGVMITASHNPSKYNGYKAYGPDGCQMTTEASEAVLAEIGKLDIFCDVKSIPFEQGLAEGRISYIDDKVVDAFLAEVQAQSVLYGESINKNVAIVYSPLNGTGLVPVTRTLREMGYTNITVVAEQEQPDGNFPTCPSPNPEIHEAMALGMEYAQRCHADLLLATDPDCDRVGIAVKNAAGGYTLLTGNQTGMLLLDYLCSQKTKHGKLPQNPVFIKTIVTTDMAARIASAYGVRTIDVLTGFKYIGEQIGLLESENRADSYVFGFEESYGYLAGSYVRDKDAVVASFLICEMFAFYATQGVSLIDKLEELYEKYGYSRNVVCSYQFEGAAGFAKMQELMGKFRSEFGKSLSQGELGGLEILQVLDYGPGLGGLPKSEVLKYLLAGNCSVIVRPSGTEPKLKAYVSVAAASAEEAETLEKKIIVALNEIIS